MLLHTDPASKVLSVFGGVPRAGAADWDDLQFYQLKALGNLAVSAVRERGSTKWIALECAAGGSFLVVRACFMFLLLHRLG
jgi:hypothetical protein